MRKESFKWNLTTVYGLINGSFIPANGPLSEYVNATSQDYADVRKMINPGDVAATYTLGNTYGVAYAAHTGGC
jgi:hypothetical protein